MVFPAAFINRVLGNLAEQSNLRVRPHLCSRARYPRSDCRLCEEACPIDAVRVEGDSVKLSKNCTGCEICIPTCPNGVFALTDSKETVRRGLLKRSILKDSCARLTCMMDKESEDEESLAFPCLAALSEAYLLAPIAWGGDKVQIKQIECGDCPLASSMGRYHDLIKNTHRLLACFGLSEERIEEVEKFDAPSGNHRERLGRPEEAIGRRDFFAFFRRRTLETAASVIPEPEEASETSRWSRGGSPARSFLLELLPQLGEVQTRKMSPSWFSGLDLEVSEACIGCNVCETLCPSGAIRREEESETTRLFFRVAECTGCKICGQACLPQAISFSEHIDLKEVIEGEERELVHVTARLCRVCGRPFQGVPGDRCSQCLSDPSRNI